MFQGKSRGTALLASAAILAGGLTIASTTAASAIPTATHTVTVKKVKTPNATEITTLAAIAASKGGACQYDASEQGALVVLGVHAKDEWTALYTVHGVPVTLKHGKLNSHAQAFRSVPKGWNDSTVKVWVGTQRCETT